MIAKFSRIGRLANAGRLLGLRSVNVVHTSIFERFPSREFRFTSVAEFASRGNDDDFDFGGADGSGSEDDGDKEERKRKGKGLKTTKKTVAPEESFNPVMNKEKGASLMESERKNEARKEKLRRQQMKMEKQVASMGIDFEEQSAAIQEDRNGALYRHDILKRSKSKVIGLDNKPLPDLLRLDQALKQAEGLGCDLILVQLFSDPPILRFGDYNKIMYRKRQAEKERARKDKDKIKGKSEAKQISMKVNIAENDFFRYCSNALEFIKEGHKVESIVKVRNNADDDMRQQAVTLQLQMQKELKDEAVVEVASPKGTNQFFVTFCPRHIMKNGRTAEGMSAEVISAALLARPKKKLDEEAPPDPGDSDDEFGFALDSDDEEVLKEVKIEPKIRPDIKKKQDELAKLQKLQQQHQKGSGGSQQRGGGGKESASSPKSASAAAGGGVSGATKGAAKGGHTQHAAAGGSGPRAGGGSGGAGASTAAGGATKGVAAKASK